MLDIQGRFLKIWCVFSITNVYASCDGEGKHMLWARLGGLINNNNEAVCCVNGYFNAICSDDERKS